MRWCSRPLCPSRGVCRSHQFSGFSLRRCPLAPSHTFAHPSPDAHARRECVRGTWDFAFLAARRKSHTETLFGGGKLKKKIPSALLPCVLGGVSATPPRLWLAAPLTAQGPRDHVWCTAAKASHRHCHLPSTSGEARALCKRQREHEDEFEENVYQQPPPYRALGSHSVSLNLKDDNYLNSINGQNKLSVREYT